jgi:hypothetical protein
MWAEESVVAESELDSALEFLLHEGSESSETKEVFESPPESLDDGDGADLSDGAQTVANAEGSEGILEIGAGELTALVGDEVFGGSESFTRLPEELGKFARGRFFGKDSSGERKSGEEVEDEGELESEEAEEAWDLGEVDEENVVGVARANGSFLARGQSLRRNSAGRLLPEDASDGSCGESKPGSGESLGDALVASEAEKAHGVDELSDDVGVAADGRVGADERSVRRRQVSAFRIPLPASDGFRGNAESFCGFFCARDEEFFETQDAISLLGSVLRSFLVGDLVPAGGEDLGELEIEVSEEEILLPFGESGLERVLGVAQRPETVSESKTQKLACFQDGFHGEAVEVGRFGEGKEGSLG